MTADDRTIERGHCPRCGLPLATHAKCAVCGLLIGPGHYASRGITKNGRVLCEECAARHQALQEGSGATKGGEQW